MLEGHFAHPSDVAEAQEQKKKDTLMIYCPSCQGRVDVPIEHDGQDGRHHQGINLLPAIAVNMKWNKMDAVCKKCLLVLDIDPILQDRQRVELKVRIDCSNMSRGHMDYYDIDAMNIERSLHTL